jgi:hypothetical protein
VQSISAASVPFAVAVVVPGLPPAGVFFGWAKAGTVDPKIITIAATKLSAEYFFSIGSIL